MLSVDAADRIAIEDFGVEIVASLPGGMSLNSPRHALRPQTMMHLPLVEVSPLLPEQCRLREQRQNVLAAEGDVAQLRPRAPIGVGPRKRLLAEREHDQCRVHVGLKTEVAMNVLGEFASTADEPRRCVKSKARSRSGTPLAGEPIAIGGEKTLSPRGYGVALL